MAEMDDRSACAWMHADRWLSADEICKQLGIVKDTVYLSALSAQAGKWIDNCDLPAHRMGRL